MGKNGFPRLIFTIAFLGIGIIALVLAVNPLEKAREQQDARFKQDSEKLTSAIQSFASLKGKPPWADDFGSNSPAVPLPWTTFSAPEVGVCSDSACQNPGDLIQSGVLESSFLAIAQTGLTRPGIFVGKGKKGNDPVFACFVPQSESLRKATGQLYRFKMGTTPLGSLEELYVQGQ